MRNKKLMSIWHKPHSMPLPHLLKNFNLQEYKKFYPEVGKIHGVYELGANLVIVVKVGQRTQVRDYNQAIRVIQSGIIEDIKFIPREERKVKLEQITKILIEAPQIIGDVDFNLTNQQK